MSLTAYVPTLWVDYADSPDLQAANLNHFEEGIKDVTDELIAFEAWAAANYLPTSAITGAVGQVARFTGANSIGGDTGLKTVQLGGVTNSLIVGDGLAAGPTSLILDAPTNQNKSVFFRSAGVTSWTITSFATSEQFAIRAVNSSGFVIDSPIAIQNAYGGAISIGGGGRPINLINGSNLQIAGTDAITSARAGDLTALTVGSTTGFVRSASGVYSASALASSDVTDALGYTPISTALKGSVNGVAELDASGKVPASQLPGSAGSIIEVANFAALPGTGTTGVIYITLDNSKTYRWGGSVYVEISASLVLGETSSTAYPGDRGKIAYDHSQITTGNPHGTTYTDVGAEPTITTLSAAKGGTGQSVYVVGDILAANTTTTLSRVAGVVTGNVLRSGGVGVVPEWGKVALSTDVSGTLQPAQFPALTGDVTTTAGTLATTITKLSSLSGPTTAMVGVGLTGVPFRAVAGLDYLAPGGVTLQAAYNASTAPQITTSVAKGAMVFRRGTAGDPDAVLQVESGGGSPTITLSGNGQIAFDGRLVQGVTERLSATGVLTVASATVTGATASKLARFDAAKALVSYDLVAADIPSLDASKITTGTFADARIASAATWNAKIGGSGTAGQVAVFTGTNTVGGFSTLTATSSAVAVGSEVFLNRSTGSGNKRLWWSTGGVGRWALSMDGTESTGDAGAYLELRSYADGGGFIDAPLAFGRAAGGTISIGGGGRPVNLTSGSKLQINGTDAITSARAGDLTALKVGATTGFVRSSGGTYSASALVAGDIPALSYLPLAGGTVSGYSTFSGGLAATAGISVTGTTSTSSLIVGSLTGILKGTSGTVAVAAAGDFPTLNQNTTGSAATLTTPRTLTIGSTGKTFNGSANVSWSLAEIGAQAAVNGVGAGEFHFSYGTYVDPQGGARDAKFGNLGIATASLYSGSSTLAGTTTLSGLTGSTTRLATVSPSGVLGVSSAGAPPIITMTDNGRTFTGSFTESFFTTKNDNRLKIPANTLTVGDSFRFLCVGAIYLTVGTSQQLEFFVGPYDANGAPYFVNLGTDAEARTIWAAGTTISYRIELEAICIGVGATGLFRIISKLVFGDDAGLKTNPKELILGLQTNTTVDRWFNFVGNAPGASTYNRVEVVPRVP